ncbi:Solute carrier organic anion transporter family member 5A1like, partial [Caligus rogercresseyi]
YVGVCSAIKVCSVVIFVIDWWLIRKRQNMEKKSGESLSVGEVVNSMISLDK